jgi:hypothetical protein
MASNLTKFMGTNPREKKGARFKYECFFFHRKLFVVTKNSLYFELKKYKRN